MSPARRVPDPIDGPGGARVFELRVEPTRSRTLESNGLTLCCVCLDGVGTLDERDGTFLIRPRFVAIRLPRWTGRINAGTAALRLLCFTWTPRALAALGDAAKGLASPRALYGRATVELAWRAAEELRVRDPYTPLAIQFYGTGVAISLSRGLLNANARESARVAKTRRRIEKSLDAPLDLRALARDAGCTPEHLTRAFRQTYGFSPTQYLLRRRVDVARRLLTSTDRSVAELARELGFHDASHFARHFRRLAGLSPIEFRARQRDVIRTAIA